jgi:hypothetical protein
MTVERDISRQIIEEEVEAMRPLASSYGWEVVVDLANLTVTVKMKSSVDAQLYIVEATCDGYKALPPHFEFIHPESGERGTQRCYPVGGSFFHSTPCICVQWNRKAYKDVGGPHVDWKMTDWISARPGMTTLGDMFHLIQREINNKNQYRGRMA